MRKILFSILLATTAASPVLAAPHDRDDRSSSREERKAERSESRQQKSEAREQRSDAREQRNDAREQRSQARDEARTQRVEQRNANAGQNFTARERPAQTERSTNVNARGRPTLSERQATTQARQDQRQQAREERQESRSQWQQQANVARERALGARPDRQAPPPQTAESHRPAPTWHTNWRNNNHYDWRRWRDRNRSIFRLGLYIDPFGWGYHRWNIGWRLWPSFYSSNYWLNDPYMYRLPYAPWPYKWIRYYDDAILVNVYSGQVVDVIYDFFW